MGFSYWYEGIIFILLFGFIIAFPCFFVAFIGTKMINNLGNFPTQAAKIQTGTIWKLFIVEIVASLFLVAFYRVFTNS